MAADDFPYMPLYWRDWLTGQSTMFMTAEQEGAFLNLLLRAWGAEPPCTLPDDDAKLAQLSKMGSRWKKHGGPVREKFPPAEPGLLRNPKQWAIYNELMAHRERRSAAGKKGNEKRWSDPNAIALRPASDTNANRKPVAKTSPSSASSLSRDTDTGSNEPDGASAPPPVDNSPTVKEWLGLFMPMLRENGFEADDTDGSILKHWHKRRYTASEVEAAIRGTAFIRSAGGLKAFEGAKLSLRLLYARPKAGAPPERRPLWNEATEKYHARMERTKRADPMAGAQIANILDRIQKHGAA